MPLYAGICETDITPPGGVWMCGYAFRPTGCVAVHDPLYARALVLDDGSASVAILGLDLIGLDFDMVETVRAGVTEQTGIPASAIMLNATHTHAGHPTTLGGENLEITADFCGYACGTVKRETDGRVMPFFLQGCCGNINPEPRGTFEHARAHGETLGEAALEAMGTAEELSGG